MTILVCSTCRKKFDTDRTLTMPFCSQRCKLVDLGRWLNEEYGLPVDPEADPEADQTRDDRA